MTLRLVMMGTGNFALPTFLALYRTSHEVACLLTQPDRTGSGHHRHVNLLKETAQERGTPVLQPENVNGEESIEFLSRFDSDLFVVAAYGQLLSDKLLRIPRLGAINVHASLLPKYRGAAPVQYAILNGETESGVSIFRIEPKLDAGPILGIEKTDIGPKDTSGELEERLACIAAPLTVRIINGLEAGTITAIPQDPNKVTKAPRMKKSDGAINWSKSAEEIGWHIRAMQPWPKAFTYLHQTNKEPTRLILLDVEPYDMSEHAESGRIVHVSDSQFVVQAGDGPVAIRKLQPEGKRPMSADDFLRGRSVAVGDWLSSEVRDD